eukprot:Blabericola_migrator_1__657@NODE_1163_length_5233_cov_27_435927_g793_i0_p2_GENE_NODE_1163_length_5233_cov_27_435927_g793_i0NODE_1163_length_5233_cov_27_435927_g793_i0_p2_ORF_typecomplete_len214_score9_52_NODE_1163_length_5233_cov_27_435927_g793_i021252766
MPRESLPSDGDTSTNRSQQQTETEHPISTSYFLRMRKSIYKQSRAFITRPSDDCRAILALPNVTGKRPKIIDLGQLKLSDPMGKATEDPFPTYIAENFEYRGVGAEPLAKTDTKSPSGVSGNEERFKVPRRDYWSNPIPAVFLGIVDCLGTGIMETFPYLMTRGSGLVLLIAIMAAYLVLVIPISKFELICGQLYQGTAMVREYENGINSICL